MTELVATTREPAPIEGEVVTDRLGDALRAADQRFSLDDLHVYLSRLLYRANRGQVSTKRAKDLKEIALAAVAVAEKCEEQSAVRAFIEAQAAGAAGEIVAPGAES